MTKKIITLFILAFLFRTGFGQTVLVFYDEKTDTAGNLIPWYNPDPGTSYDHDLGLIWNFWNAIPDSAGIKFYMLDHSYSPTIQYNMVGGDQFAMALSSEELYYAYTGDTAVLNNMIYIANTYLANSLSAPTDSWPNIPYPCNTPNPMSPVYAGDYLQSYFGQGITQPDKAGSFGAELVTLYKITGDSNYLNTAVNIANTLAGKVQPGDATNSPYPFRVNASTGANPTVNYGAAWAYCGNVSPTMRLFENLNALHIGNTVQYDTAYNILKNWVRTYPENTNQWGTFFEDIGVPSNTETNAVTMAYYILQHPNWSSTYQQEARAILNWTFGYFGDTAYSNVGVTAIFEQSADLKPGGSHTSRYASTELLYSQVTGDTTRVAEAIRELNWCTYLVDTTGACMFSPAEGSVWYTDGYGDYVRHFIRAMAAYPQIAPDSANHLLGTSSVVTHITYQPQVISYTTWDDTATEVLRVTTIPLRVEVNRNEIAQLSSLTGEGWTWTPLDTGGVLKIYHVSGNQVTILWNLSAISNVAASQIGMQLYPNPANTSVNIQYSSGRNESVKLDVLDAIGQTLTSINLNATPTVTTQVLNVATWPAGIYFIRMSSGEGQLVRKLVIER